jgi:hypothetical protein
MGRFAGTEGNRRIAGNRPGKVQADDSRSPFFIPSAASLDRVGGGGWGEEAAAAMSGVMGRLRVFVVKEPVVAASCLIAGFGTLSRLPRGHFCLCSVSLCVCIA